MTRNSESAAYRLMTPGDEGASSVNMRVTHMETYEGTRTGELIRVSCDCVISSNHTYAEWLNRPQNTSIGA